MSLPSAVRTTLAGAVLLFAAAACDEKREQLAPTAPTAAKTAPADAAVPTVDVTGKSSVCRKYEREAKGLKAALRESPKDEKLVGQARALASIMKDACS